MDDEGKQGPVGPRVIVFYDDQNEVQVGTNADLHPGEMRLMLQAAAAKLELLEFRMMVRAMEQQRQSPGLVVARRNVDGLKL